MYFFNILRFISSEDFRWFFVCAISLMFAGVCFCCGAVLIGRARLLVTAEKSKHSILQFLSDRSRVKLDILAKSIPMKITLLCSEITILENDGLVEYCGKNLVMLSWIGFWVANGLTEKYIK